MTDSTLDQLHTAMSMTSSLGSGSRQRGEAAASVQILQAVFSMAAGAGHIHPLQLGTSTRGLEGRAGARVAVGELPVSSGSAQTLSVCGFWAGWAFPSLSCSKMRLQRVEGSWVLQEETSGARKGHSERVLWGREHHAVRRQSETSAGQPTCRV